MIKPTLDARVILRLPKFSYEDDLQENWQELKQLIRGSSPDFFELIKEITFEELTGAERKIQLTVRKYYNRALFRSTPFGAFATIGMARLSWLKNDKVSMTKDTDLHIFSDWKDKPKQVKAFPLTKFRVDLKIFSNTSFYCVQNEIRYIKKEQESFHLASVDFNPLIIKTLTYCCIPRTLEEITEHIAEADTDEVYDFILELIELQLLLTSDQPNIIGEDYFTRMGIKNDQGRKQYVIAERRVHAGTFDSSTFRHLPELVQILQKITGVTSSVEFNEFKNNLIRRFDQTEVPLMVALDPETGIGYGSFTSHIISSPIAKLMAMEPGKQPETMNGIKNALYREILVNNNNNQPIDLPQLVWEQNIEGALPNSLSAICTIADGNVFLESLGGVSATALAGRFALAISEVRQYCAEIAALEQKSNPGVLFFDIGYTKEADIDNVNRRPSIYGAQLNILNYDTSPAPLCINDILISVQRGVVVLRSRSQGVRLVPRLASAYNYKRSDLALFRLLTDIQSQELKADLLIRPSSMIPGLPYYPRIQFRNIIVSPASWMIQSSIIKGISDWKNKCHALQDHLREKIHCDFVKAGVADQTLCLSIGSFSDMELLLSLLEKQDKLYVEEVYVPKESIVVDDRGKSMIPQLVLTLTHSNEILKSLGPLAIISDKQWIPPGREWLYFEIYCNPFRSDLILENKIKDYLESNKRKIRSWFFIRYDEDGDHIRLRLKLKEQSDGHLLVSRLSDLLEEELNSGIISDLKLRTYKKEVHRYSGRLIDAVEEHFHIDSKFVISLAKSALSEMQRYRLCIALLEAITFSKLFDNNSLEDIIHELAASFNAEFRIARDGFKEINQLYKSLYKEGFPALSKRSEKLYADLIASFIRTITSGRINERQKLFADLMHMHINRLFTVDQRLQELIIYNLYLLTLKSAKYNNLNSSGNLRA